MASYEKLFAYEAVMGRYTLGCTEWKNGRKLVDLAFRESYDKKKPLEDVIGDRIFQVEGIPGHAKLDRAGKAIYEVVVFNDETGEEGEPIEFVYCIHEGCRNPPEFDAPVCRDHLIFYDELRMQCKETEPDSLNTSGNHHQDGSELNDLSYLPANKIVLFFYGLSDSQRKLCSVDDFGEVGKSNGRPVVEENELSENVTHFVVGLDKPDAKWKIAYAIAHDKYVMHSDWMKHSISKKRILPEEKFLVCNFEGFEGMDGVRKRLNGEHNPFQGIYFHFPVAGKQAQSFTEMTKGALKELGAVAISGPLKGKYKEKYSDRSGFKVHMTKTPKEGDPTTKKTGDTLTVVLAKHVLMAILEFTSVQDIIDRETTKK